MLRSGLFLLIFIIFSCSAKPPSLEPEILPCYKAKNFEEYDLLSSRRKKNPGQPLIIKGKKYACVENAQVVEANCYIAKNKKEFAKLSRKQEKHHGRPVKIDGKYYLCIQNVN